MRRDAGDDSRVDGDHHVQSRSLNGFGDVLVSGFELETRRDISTSRRCCANGHDVCEMIYH